MANWYQRKPSDDAKLIMLLQLGQVDVVIAALQLSQARCEADGDVVPASVEPLMPTLISMGLAPSTDDSLHFLRMKRKHRGTTRYPVASGGTTENHVAPDKKRTEQKREEKKGERAPRAPKQPPKGRRALDAFNAAVTEVTGSPSTTMGISMERKAAAMQEAIDAAGETWTQAVKRRHDLGKSLNLHWMANDYASDRTMRQRPGITRPNLSNNLLQTDHPDGAGEEYWLQGIEKYKYGGTNG
jgi:hypothetical protein